MRSALNDALTSIIEPGEAQRLATGFVFTEGPLWHPDDFYYFVDIRASVQYTIRPGEPAKVFRSSTGGSNGTTFDLQGRLVTCDGESRRVSRVDDKGNVEVLFDRFEGKRLNRPNDIVCRSDGSLFFTDPGLRVPLAERELPGSAVYRVSPEGNLAGG